MTIRRYLALGLGLCAGTLALAQEGLRLTATPTLNLPAPPVGSLRQADYIVAIVNSEPITHQELQTEVQRQLQQIAQQRQPRPDVASLQKQVLERLIQERVQLQWAREIGVRVDEKSLEQAEQMVARQNQIDLPELHRRLVADGISLERFRSQLREQLTLNRLRERELEPRLKVSELEIDQYLQEQSTLVDPASRLLQLAQILVAVPDEASDAQVATLKARADGLLARARAGEDFTALAREASDAQDRAAGGQLGLRPVGRYPQLFVDATAAVPVGQLAPVIRSGAGFHILKVLERRDPGLPDATVAQTRVRHILLRPGPQLSEAAAVEQLADFRRRILAGQADFAALARAHSQDGSAAQGGDLGWSTPGLFVPEFEQAMEALAPGQLGEPFTSRFGVHLIEVQERRSVAATQREQREAVRAQLRERKLAQAYPVWAQDLRGRAYVELREAPP
ncbi:MAG: molecular chaperone SurA [Rhodoferax sp.]|nr:molecular chaperone SurA [Rhodoferax sp.]